ncbi:SapB/AmfS family lanthipeptide [Streptomyces jumonjinensis]|uniref:SapB/AmfS family lantipeptide n=1 Tax=Streptomyces jumonjinensis TaxID=1945 RepID=A0A646KL35_STRJU|nr:SapB/AmfS family lanthipeptide [Streptomyces jumonjinensis]MQT03024.1 SapB/AmfS family lantipeptide [Streptomyces jumonjinensis]
MALLDLQALETPAEEAMDVETNSNLSLLLCQGSSLSLTC